VAGTELTETGISKILNAVNPALAWWLLPEVMCTSLSACHPCR
jgi:hypothetical protein